MSDEPKKPFNSPFAGLAGLRDTLPRGPSPEEQARTKAPPNAVVRMERTGRGGKEVTVIEQLELPVEQRDVWLKELKTSLGCGGAVEGSALVIQGDHREKVAKWLSRRGVKKVSVG